MYDWAASAVQTTIMVAVFPIYFVRVAGADVAPSSATQRLAAVNTIALVVTALLSPVLGALSDSGGLKKRLLAAFMILGAAAVAGMFLIERGDLDLASILFTLSLIGAAGSFVFYEALLPHIATPREIDQVSTAGYALGYIGGGLLLAFNLAWIQNPAWFGLPSGPDISAIARDLTGAACLPVRCCMVAALLDPTLPPSSRAGGPARAGRILHAAG